MLALGLIVCCWTEWIIVCELTASDSLLDFCRFDAFAEFTSPYQQNFLKTWKGHTFPRESVGQWALVIWASTPPLLRRTARNMRYWLAGYLPCCLDIYYHRHIMVLRALVMMVLSGSKYYAGNLMAIINILKDKAQFPSSGWDVKYKSYKRKVQWCNVMVCTDLIGYSTEAPNSQSLIMQ